MVPYTNFFFYFSEIALSTNFFFSTLNWTTPQTQASSRSKGMKANVTSLTSYPDKIFIIYHQYINFKISEPYGKYYPSHLIAYMCQIHYHSNHRCQIMLLYKVTSCCYDTQNLIWLSTCLKMQCLTEPRKRDP